MEILKKDETVEEFLARGGKVKKLIAQKTPKRYSNSKGKGKFVNHMKFHNGGGFKAREGN